MLRILSCLHVYPDVMVTFHECRTPGNHQLEGLLKKRGCL